MTVLKQSVAYRLTFYMVGIQDSISGKTGLTDPNIQVIKVNGSTRTIAGYSNATWTEVDATDGPGLYTLDITAAETDTIGELLIRVSHASVRDQVRLFQVTTNTLDDLALASSLTTVQGDIASLLTDTALLKGDVTDIRDAEIGRWTLDVTATPKKLTLYRVGGSILKQFNLTETTSVVSPVVDKVPI